MTYPSRFLTTDGDLFRRYAHAVTAGKAFVFLDREAFLQAGLAWGPELFDPAVGPRPQVVSLLRTQPVDLPGLSIRPLELPACRLAGITSDKALYREGNDAVRLLVLDLQRPGAEVVLDVACNGAAFTRRPVLLNRNGVAAFVLHELPAGEYEVRFGQAPAEEPPCTFRVAGYRLAPLVAELLERRLDDAASLALRLRLTTFGLPVEGMVRLELTDRERPIAHARAVSRGGLVEAAFALAGEGPHAVNVFLAADPARTATVPLPGSRQAERTPTNFSVLGTEVAGSLLPGSDARSVRGIFLRELGRRATPFELERVDTHRARLVACQSAEAVRVVLVNPASRGERANEVARAAFAAGETIEVEVPAPFGLLAVGAYVDGTPWEGWAAVIRPEQLSPRIHVPPAPVPGSRVAIDLETGCAGEPADVFVVVKDARLLAPDTPVNALAGQIKSCVERAAPRLTTGTVARQCSFLKYRDFAEVLVDRGVITPEQLRDVRGRQGRTGSALRDLLVKLGYATGQEIADALAVYHGLSSFDLVGVDIPQSVIELVPESVAREIVCLPLFQEGRTLRVVVGDPADLDTVQKLQFILNKDVEPLFAPREQIIEAINWYYGQSETESVDSMLQEFTDTAIDFCLFEGGPPMPTTGLAEPARPTTKSGRWLGTPSTTGGAAAEPEVLFAGLLEARNGRARVAVRLGTGCADYLVEAFVVGGLDWAAAEARFRAAKDPFVALDLPAFVQGGDVAPGRVHAGAGSGRMRVRVLREGVAVPLLHDGRPLTPGAEVAGTQAQFGFLAEPGRYEAAVEDPVAGVADRAAGRVDVPGKLRSIARALHFLEPGQACSLGDDPTVRTLRVLPGVERPFHTLAEATADYEHCCCEQTAAKVLAACALYTLAEDPERRARAEAVILAGIRREAAMWLRGRGFKAYPEWPDRPDPYLGPCAARYLRNLAHLRHAGPPSPVLAEAIGQGLAMAADASTAYGMPWPPNRASTCADAYAVACFGDEPRARERSLKLVREWNEGGGGTGARNRCPWTGAVARRADAAYAAACLFRLGNASDRPRALAVANAALKHIGDGRLYSTVDSVAAIALMAELRAARLLGGATGVEVNGRRLGLREAAEFAGEVRSVRAVDGVVVAESARVVEEDWETLPSNVPLRVFLEKDGRPTTRFRAGDSLELRVTLKAGYRAGDLLWVCLPDALTRVMGGGQVKRFSADFAGRDEVRVPLAATSATVDRAGGVGRQRFAACVRNMFEEETLRQPGASGRHRISRP